MRLLRFAMFPCLLGALAGCGDDPCSNGGDHDHDGHVAAVCGGDDCDDGDAQRFPGNAELCDMAGHDEDCNAATLGPDADGDGFYGTMCCQDGGDAGHVCGTDCDDTNAAAHPGATELCDGRDENCDGALDDGLTTMPYYADCDGDGHGAMTAAGVAACVAPALHPTCAGGSTTAGWVTSHDDCDDAVASAHPGGTESCNGVDDDCDGTVDGAPAAAMCPGGPNVTMPTCAAAACGLACSTGFLDCTAAAGCETDGTTPANCGGCAHTCAWTTCNAGSCDDATQLDGGFSHTCARLGSGVVYCWGGGRTGALGDGLGTSSPTPVRVSGVADAAELASGDFFTCVRRTGGVVSCWGINAHGQCGDGGAELNDHAPVDVSGLSDAIAIGAGNEHACAVRMDGTVVCWGRNDAGQLGDGTTTDAHAPVAVASITAATAIAAGAQHTCVIRGGGNVECWGDNTLGQLGHGTTTPSAVPVYVSGVTDATQIVAGGNHTCVLRATGAVSCWGENTNGQLGDNTMHMATTVVAVYMTTTATQISAGKDSSCAILAGGRVRCWGHDDHGQLGEGIAVDSPIPVEVHGLTDALAIGSGEQHSCARRMAGGVVCWGANAAGQLGDGTTTDAGMFVTVLPP